jgi:NADPH:quinone reductase-like Zn-dependent oxidoreductase
LEKGKAMKAFVVDRYGKKERLRVADMPEPALREDEVLIQVHATAVNLLDVKIRNGEFPRRPPKLPHLWPPKLLHLAGVS